MTIDLTAHFGRLKLQSPIIAGSCPLTGDEQVRAELEEAGVGAIVLPSLFQEQVILWNEQSGKPISEVEKRVLARSKNKPFATACDSADLYLSVVNRASVLASVPIIASLNGDASGDWLDFAGELQETGAAAIELNIQVPPPREFKSSGEIEDRIVEMVSTIGQSVTIPVFVKLSSSFTSSSHLAARLASGVAGLVLFSRRPDVDIDLQSLSLTPVWGLTQPGSVVRELSSLMRIHSFCPAIPIAVSGGISTADDLLKALLAGGDVGMVTSALYRSGPQVVANLLQGLTTAMQTHGWSTLNEIYNRRPLEFSGEDERLEYVKALAARKR